MPIPLGMAVTRPYVQTRVFRSPYWMAGWVVTVIAVVGTVAFFVGVTWTEFAGTYGGYLNLAKVPLSAVIVSLCGSVGRTHPSRLHRSRAPHRQSRAVLLRPLERCLKLRTSRRWVGGSAIRIRPNHSAWSLERVALERVALSTTTRMACEGVDGAEGHPRRAPTEELTQRLGTPRGLRSGDIREHWGIVGCSTVCR